MSRPLLTAKGNGTQPFTFPGISRGENSAHQLLISPGTHYCWVDRGTMGWEDGPTLLHMSNSAPLPGLPPTALSPLSFATMSWLCLTLALPPLANHTWRLPCHHIYIATLSQTWLTIALPPSVKHGWRLPATSQTRLTFALPPMSRTPCPIVPNVLDIQHLHLRAIYIVHCSWMNIAVCKQVSGWLILVIVYTWKLTYIWTLYHLCDSISICIKEMSLSHHMWWYLLMWQKIW